MKVAEYLADRLFSLGVRKVFGIPGGPSIPYMEAFRNAGIEFILTSNEASAGIMADVTYRITGVPGICHGTFGPGATNISTGVGGALLDRSAVIVFTTEMPDAWLNRTAQMNIDHQQLFKPITKATFRLNPDNAVEVLESAINICRSEYPGPVHIGLPSDIASKEIVTGHQQIVPERKSYKNNIKQVLHLIENARMPILAIGLTAARLNIRNELLNFLERFNMPVLLTPMAKGLLPENHQHYAGVLFHSLSDYLEDIIEKTDLVIGLGYDPVEFNYESWIPDVPLLHFDIIESDLPAGDRILQYIGPFEEWFQVLGNLNSSSLIFESSVINDLRDEMKSVFNGFSAHFGPVSAVTIIQNELPVDAIITTDVGSHLHLLGQLWKTNGQARLIMTNGWSGMGFGLPAALAIQMNKPSSTVVCITGDGGFLMMAGEIITARRYNLPVIVIVFSDGELNLIKVKQSWSNLSPYGTLLYQGDLFNSDSFLGVRVIKADSTATMTSAINVALSLNEPVIINAIIDPDDYNWLIVKR
ncbi:MAG TPA: thiamine pyrophosphate-binding protein [Bacteroidales bacterium]|nr:thiamine pyrophosphate-binding protein [Bacteroidales bacterium]